MGIDIHNDHADAHPHPALGRPLGDDDFCVELSGSENCLYNTSSFTDPFERPDLWGSHAAGVNWGYEGDPELILELADH